jgi:hypothetical protein
LDTRLVDKIIRLEPAQRVEFISQLSADEKMMIASMLDAEIDNPWAKYERDPVGFITEGLGESLWSKQVEILESLKENKRTVVPACHAPGKSHLAARAVAWWIASHPPGTAVAVTTATTHRQVRNILWKNIRQLAAQNDLPGDVLTVQWKINNTVVGYGFSPAAHDETAVQGIHAPNLLVVVDEAGGISDTIGKALESLMTGGHTRLLVLGNPPTDLEDTWFERICNSPLYNVIPISAHDTPNFTGEKTERCRSCPAHVDTHDVASHLVDKVWVNDVISEFGDDSPFVEARVHARFPRSSAGKVIPFTWAEMATQNDDFIKSDEIRLGVDIASDGGDEFVIAEADGYSVKIVHRSSGQANANAVDVAQVIQMHIDTADKKHKERGVEKKVRVKIDTIGVGWGVVSLMQKWGEEKRHNGQIVPINVAERAQDEAKFRNVRAEMWWNGRTLVQPIDEKQSVHLDIDRQTLTQLAGPLYKSDSSGRIQIEAKADMKKRGVHSPDRAEAVLLAIYEPKKINELVPTIPLSFAQSNPWKL